MARYHLHQAFRLQLPQNLAHDGTAHPELIAKRPLDQSLAGLEVEIHDRLAHALQRQRPQRLGGAVDPQRIF
jgi:hypothetical protein